MRIMEKSTYVRYIAVKVPLFYISHGTYAQEDAESPHFLLAPDNTKLYRLNVMATILGKELQGNITNIYVDDGTGKVTVRSFEEHPGLRTLSIGDVVLVIGKVRVYNQEKYISPEIIKKVPPSWLAVRMMELGPALEKISQLNASVKQMERVPDQAVVEEVVGAEDFLPREKITNIIRDLDSGQGALIEDVIEKSPLPSTEQLLETMLQRGDIFQIVPGRVKVL